MNALESFVNKHLRLIKIEHDEEINERTKQRANLTAAELQRRGICLNKLRIIGSKTGLFGRLLITFANSVKDASLCSHTFSFGDIVGVYRNNDRQEQLASGVVSSVNSTSICVAFEKSCDDLKNDEINFCLIKLSNEVTFKRLQNALNWLKTYPSDCRASSLINVLFTKQNIGEPLCIPELDNLSFFNAKLNESQKEGVKFALKQREVAIIHGPPGTGKTTTLVEFIAQSVKKGDRVLVCAPSNVAVDNMVEKLSDLNMKNMVRLGHPARVLSGAQQYSLDAILSRSDDYKLIDDIRKEIDTIHKSRSSSALKQELHLLVKELKRREKKALYECLRHSKIVLSTLTGCGADGVLKVIAKSTDPDDYFDVVVIDECSQAIEASCWIALGYASKCVLAGDHKQLPPTILSEKAAKEGLDLTLMERLLALYSPESIMRMLTIQYRMNEQIMTWSSDKFYEKKLVAHISNISSKLSDIIPSLDIEPLLLIDTAGCFMTELDVEDEESKGNEAEASIAALYIQKLINYGIDQKDIGIITPYNLQVELIRNRISEKYPNLEVKSVDGFQGREKEVIILSLVRSNDKHEVGFLREYRRINVAITRAKRHLVVICDSETVSNDETLHSLIDYLMTNGEVICAQEFENDLKMFDDIERPPNLRFKCKSNNKEKERTKLIKKENSKQKLTEIFTEPSTISEYNRRERIKDKFRKILLEFIKNEQEIYIFPPQLSSFERMIVHEVAEELNLIHQSKGNSENRVLEVKKLLNKQSSTDLSAQVSEENYNERIGPFNVESNKRYEINDVKVATKDLAAKSKVISKEIKRPEKKDKLKSVKSKLKDMEGKVKCVDEENFDELIATFTKLDKICAFNECKSKTSVLGQSCSFCKRNFCISHSMPEVHGCEDAARAHAKSTFRKVGKLNAGLGYSSQKTDPLTRKQLEKQLEKKVNEMVEKRKAKRK
ncbi:DNA-binding protein SMUBP-2-like protein [Dinothrombium tinctorium]|uniref:DNA-binding protein SMUBP-2-like protein n=1 Tax=Dinothrombium tinctorium TaxID=1965070 RepID=A0A3S3P8A5_9ACAR|nr:DNA-binding protein SMUBP-2-like protein [Dinothrombium tinctorium]